MYIFDEVFRLGTLMSLEIRKNKEQKKRKC